MNNAKLMATVLTLGLTACCTDPSRPFFAWEIGTHPRAVLADGTTDPRWTQIVEDARAKWAGPLVQMHCDDPFRGSATNDVVLIPDSQWALPFAIGDTQPWGILVKGTMDELDVNLSYRTVLPHELGHALGLDHVLSVDDPDSIMHAAADKIAPDLRDIENAERAIGCIN